MELLNQPVMLVNGDFKEFEDALPPDVAEILASIGNDQVLHLS
jgi:hypothetical protein